MSNEFIGIDIIGEDVLAEKLKKLPPAVQDAAVDEVSSYLLNILKAYPSKNYITRTTAYGKSFFTDKQRKWFFASLNDGSINIPYRRTQGLARAWEKLGSGAYTILVNEAQGAKYVIGDKTQSRHEMLVGWRTVGQVIKVHTRRIIEKADAGAKKALRKLGLQ